MKNRTTFSRIFYLVVSVFIFAVIISFFISCKSGSKEKKNLHSKREAKSEVSKISGIDFSIPDKNNYFSISEISVSEFTPDKNARLAISDYVSNLSGSLGKYSAESEFFDNLAVYPIKNSFVEVNLASPAIFAFSPECSGSCTMGFCDENGIFCSEIVLWYNAEKFLKTLQGTNYEQKNFKNIFLKYFYCIVGGDKFFCRRNFLLALWHCETKYHK